MKTHHPPIYTRKTTDGETSRLWGDVATVLSTASCISAFCALISKKSVSSQKICDITLTRFQRGRRVASWVRVASLASNMPKRTKRWIQLVYATPAVVSERPKSRPPKCRRAAFEFKQATALSYHWLTIYLSLPTSCSVLASPSAPAWCSKSSRKFSRPHSKIAEKVAFITCGCAETCQIGLSGPWLWNLEWQQISFQKPSWKNWFQPGCCCAAPMIGENNNTDVPDCPIHDCNSDIHYIAAL